LFRTVLIDRDAQNFACYYVHKKILMFDLLNRRNLHFQHNLLKPVFDRVYSSEFLFHRYSEVRGRVPTPTCLSMEGGVTVADKAEFKECLRLSWTQPYILQLVLSAGIGGLLFGYDTGI
jgi:hypothetical protein